METIIEYGCQQCGAQIMKPTIPPPYNACSQATTKCDECGYETDVFKMYGFQCSDQIHSSLHRFCTRDELKQLRLNPKNFIPTLNGKLAAGGKQELEVDTTTEPPTVRKKL